MTPERDEERRVLSEFSTALGVHVADVPVCEGHHAPLDFLEAWCYDRPSASVVLGPRGGGKSYLAALATVWDSLAFKGHGTRVLGGSEAQSRQIYDALKEFAATGAGSIYVRSIAKEAATFHNGSDVSILAASSRSVRGPHVPTLRLDEIDEIDSDIRESAMGMCMARGEARASVSMTSTWHRVGGPMAELIDRARNGEFPLWHFCTFEVLERCPDIRSGPNLERCPECLLVQWCHDTAGLPKAKRANGHYAIDSLIQKVLTVSRRVFEADYLCAGPKADGVWFPQFDEARHVNFDSEYDPFLPVHLAVDSGVFTGAVFYQIHDNGDGFPSLTVFADYLAEGLTAENNAVAILEVARVHCNGKIHERYSDPAGGARNPVGPRVLEIYETAGLALDKWPVTSVSDGLSQVESLLMSAGGTVRLTIHPRCQWLIDAFRGYRRKKRAGQWTDDPEDPQHPYEDVMDALRGGVMADFGGLREAVSGGDPFGNRRW